MGVTDIDVGDILEVTIATHDLPYHNQVVGLFCVEFYWCVFCVLADECDAVVGDLHFLH